MAYETKELTGSMFPNKDKKSPNHPDYSGSIRIDGHDYWLSGWRKTSSNGTAWMSLAFKQKDGTSDRPKQETQRSIPLDDDVPFAPEVR